MTAIPTANKVVEIEISKTLEQEFSSGTSFSLKGVKVTIQVLAYFNFDKYRAANKVLVTIEWRHVMIGWTKYITQTQYHVDCTNYDNEKKQIGFMISDSLNRIDEEFSRRTKNVSLKVLFSSFGQPNVNELMEEISLRLHQKS
jgi:hypothetical protein